MFGGNSYWPRSKRTTALHTDRYKVAIIHEEHMILFQYLLVECENKITVNMFLCNITPFNLNIKNK